MRVKGRPIRVAIVGPGKIAQDQHVPAIAASAAFELVATVAKFDAPAEWPTFQSVSELLANGPAIDAVAICTPPQVRGEIALEAISAGLDVLLEKPPAMTPSEIAAISRAAAAKDVVLFATWHSRFAPMVGKVRQIVAEHGLASGKITWREDVHKWHPGQTWLWEPGGLGVFDPGINALSILTSVSNVPFHVKSAEFEVPVNRHAPIAAQLQLQTGDVLIEVDLDFRQTGKQSWDIELTCCNGTRVALGLGGSTLAIDGERIAEAAEAEYPGIYRHFAQLIDARTSDVDCAPLQLVADAFLVARINRTEEFFP